MCKQAPAQGCLELWCRRLARLPEQEARAHGEGTRCTAGPAASSSGQFADHAHRALLRTDLGLRASRRLTCRMLLGSPAPASACGGSLLLPPPAAPLPAAQPLHQHHQSQQCRRILAQATTARRTPSTTAAPQEHSSSSGSGPAAAVATSLDLWRTLLLASGSKMAEAVAAANGVARLQRLVEPPPQGAASDDVSGGAETRDARRAAHHPALTRQRCAVCGTGFPPGPAGEQVAALLGGPLEFLQRTRAEHGDVVGLLLGGERVVLVADSQVARQVREGREWGGKRGGGREGHSGCTLCRAHHPGASACCPHLWGKCQGLANARGVGRGQGGLKTAQTAHRREAGDGQLGGSPCPASHLNACMGVGVAGGLAV